MASIPAKLMGRIARNGARGKAARLFLRRNVSRLSPEEIAKLPASTLKRIGRELRAAAMGQANETVGAASGQITPPASSSSNRTKRIPSLIQLLIEAVICIVALTVTAVAVERPVRWGLYHIGLFSSEQMGLCQRLDRWSDGCSFEVRTDGLGIDQVAVLVDMPPAVLAAANPTLFPYEPLPRGTLVRISRSGGSNE